MKKRYNSCPTCSKRKKLLCETKLCIHDHITNKTKPNIIFRNFYEFRKKLIEKEILTVEEGEDKYSLWSKVCFQNYIQTITTHEENDQFEIKIKSFNDVFARMLKNKKPSKCYNLLKKHLKENGK